MPTVRIMADGRPIMATAGTMDRHGVPVFRVGGGNTISLTIDYTAFLGSATIASDNWTVQNATQGDASTTGAKATTLLILPTVLLGDYPSAYDQWTDATTVWAVHRLTASDGRIHNAPVRFQLDPASGTDLFILDGSYLA